jgi:hypothetical protein
MQDVPDYQTQQGGTMEARDINAHNVVVGNQYNTIVYPNIPVRPVDSATLAAAQQQLARLPLETIPAITPLPSGSRMLFAPNRRLLAVRLICKD